MSGHNKWAQIKHKKAVVDARKGKVFGKLARAIAIAARDNPDPSTNLRLKGEIERAREVNMPSDNIERAIRRVSDKNAASLGEVRLELIGPGNAALIITAITDNSNRTINELKQLVAKMGARMTGQGSVAWMFQKKVTPSGLEYFRSVPLPVTDPADQAALERLLEALDEHDDVQDVFTNAEY